MELKEGSSKERLLDFSKLTLLRHCSERIKNQITPSRERVLRGSDNLRTGIWLALQQKQREQKKILLLQRNIIIRYTATSAQEHPGILLDSDLSVREICRDPPLISYQRGTFSKGYTRASEIIKRLSLLGVKGSSLYLSAMWPIKLELIQASVA